MNWLSVRTPLKQTDVELLEKEFCIHLPDDYKSQIASINGGALKNAYIRLPRLGDVPYSRNVPLHKGARASIYDLLSTFRSISNVLFPFASVGNGDYFCFDLQSNTVVLFIHETQSTLYVCDTFTQLLEKLVCE